MNNTNPPYQITGRAITVGAGGIIDAPAGNGSGDVIKAPIVLTGATQPWAIGSSNGYKSLTLLGGITSSDGTGVTVSTPHGSDLFIDSDMKAGPVTSNGPGTLHIGGKPGSGNPGSVNGDQGQPLTIAGGRLIPNPSSASGSLTMNGGTTLLLGTFTTNTHATTLHVNGTAHLSSSTTTQTFINGNGTIAGTDFSQLSANDDITVGGALTIGHGPNSSGSCVALNPGAIATLVTTSGTLAGTFSGVPDGAVVNLAGPCSGTASQVRIDYTSNSVTATVLGPLASTTTALAAPSPAPATTNQQGPQGSAQRRTLPVSAVTSRATRVGKFQATLNGSVSGASAPLPWRFEYGRTKAYGHVTANRVLTAGAHTRSKVSLTLKSLAPNVRYHFRLVVRTKVGTIAGEDRTFTTNAQGMLTGPAGTLTVVARTIPVVDRCRSTVTCRGRITLTRVIRTAGRAKAQTVRCAGATVSVRAGRTATIQLTVSAACLQLLRSDRHHRLSVSLTVTAQTGQSGERERIMLVLRPPFPPRSA